MSLPSKLMAAMVIILIFSLSTMKFAEHYSQENVEASPIVKSVSKKINTAIEKAAGFSPENIGTFIPTP